MRALADFGFDGREALRAVIEQSEWKTLPQALASFSVFAHPDAVKAVGGRAVFRTVRGPKGLPTEGCMGDDNSGPDSAFLWATSERKSRPRDLQCNHIWSRSGAAPAAKDVEAFTDLRNICYTPTFLAKMTDYQSLEAGTEHLARVLQYRAYQLYGYCGPSRMEPPAKPDRYDSLIWPKAQLWGEGATREVVELRFRRRLGRSRQRDHLKESVQQFGWAFSSGPDPLCENQ